jgi:hypothetical protein
MGWHLVETIPIDIDSGVAPARARAVAAALARRAVPVLAMRHGRAEPLASGALYEDGATLLLLTCRHLFDLGLAVGDLGLPLGDGGPVLSLGAARASVFADRVRDLAAVRIGCRHACTRLRRYWRPAPLRDLEAGSGCQAASPVFVLAGFPYAQMRRVDAALHARPVVVFARGVPDEEALRARYARIAHRIDGVAIHAPALDGVSGATLWVVGEERDDGVGCVLQPVGVQAAFRHDAYLRAEPAHGFARVLRERAL